MSAIEADYRKVVKFRKDEDDFEDRQEYLKALMRKLNDIPGEEGDILAGKLTEEAYEWYESAIEAYGKKQEIPDFADAEVEEVEEVEGNGDASEEQESSGVGGDDDATLLEVVDDQKPEDEITTEGEIDGGAEGSDDPDPSEDEDLGEDPTEGEEAAEPASKGKTKGKKKVAKKAKLAKPPAKKKAVGRVHPDYNSLTGEKNKWGITKGTKMDAACEMMAKGATMQEIEEETGDTQYNLVKKLQAWGHKVDREGLVYKLTHKDSIRKGK